MSGKDKLISVEHFTRNGGNELLPELRGEDGQGMKDTFELTLNNPLTEEQWDRITDVDFDQTDRITFHTKHGKEVEFTKVIRCKECKHYDKFISQNIGQGWCDVAAWRGRYMRNDDFCSRAEPKERTGEQ